MKVLVWGDGDRTRKELQKRIFQAFEKNKKWQAIRDEAERTITNITGEGQVVGGPLLFSQLMSMVADDGESGNNGNSIGVNYTMKNVRFIHAQMSANPPTVAVKPTTSDAQDRRKAEAAELLKQWFLREYEMPEVTDLVTLETIIYGTGVGKLFYDKNGGEDVVSFDQETGTIEMSGDICYKPVHLRYFAIDPDARKWKDVRYCVEKIFIPYEEAMSLWPDKQELIESARIQNSSPSDHDATDGSDFYDVVEIYEYWEKGLPVNGMQGRYAICLQDGSLLEPVRTSPHKFSKPTAEGNLGETEEDAEEETFEVAQLPYIILTDIDVPNEIFGLSALMYAMALQNAINHLDSSLLDNARAHSAARLIIPDGGEVMKGGITTDPFDVIRVAGTSDPHFAEAQPMQVATVQLREQLVMALNDVFGVNESMFGQQSREQSGFSMQYATNQGNMIRRRLFNKYTKYVETAYKFMFQLARKHWKVKRVIKVIGNESSVQAVALSGADLVDGFDLVGEYGTNLSLDPITRRQEIMSMYQLLIQADHKPQDILEMLKLSDFSRPSLSELSKRRQREIVEAMIKKTVYIAPEQWEEHPPMMAWLRYYTMTKEFYQLDDEHKALILQHKDDRQAIMSQMAAQAQAGVGQDALAQAMGGAPQAPGAAPADVTQIPPMLG